MKEVEIIKSGESDNGFWALLQNEEKKHTIVNTAKILDAGKNRIDSKIYNISSWLEFETTHHLELKFEEAKYGYNRNSRLEFGMYKGYELGIVYLFDAHYIEWCIHNIPEFFIEDLEILERFGIMKYNFDYQAYREYKDGDLNPFINHFNTIQEAVSEVGMSFIKYSLPKSSKQVNNKKYLSFFN